MIEYTGKDARHMLQNVIMTVLVDNIASGTLAAEWGLSILITADDRRILLDTGSSSAFARNAELLGVDLAAVDTGVLSHAHYDHADGMEAFFRLNRTAPFLVRSGVSENCWGIKDGAFRYNGIRKGILQEYRERIRYVSGVYSIDDGIWLIPHRKMNYRSIAKRNELYVERSGRRVFDDFSHEQSLVIDSGRGLIVFSSCSHTGMINILEDIYEALGRRDVSTYVGGLHLYKLTDRETAALTERIHQTSVRRILTGHCTGDQAFSILKSKLGDGILQFSAGFSYSF